MIEAIKEIGEYSLNKEGKRLEDPLDIIVKDPASSPNYKHVLAIILNKTEKGFEFSGIRHEEYTKEKVRKYLYRTGPSGNSPDMTPTSKITDIERTFNKKILRWFKSVFDDKSVKLGINDVKFLEELNNCLINNKDAILSELKAKRESFGKDETGIITFLINDGVEKYVGEFSVFKELLIKNSTAGYYQKYNTESIAEKKICSVCREHVEKVYGFVSTYKFYTVDKPGFVSGGFDQSLAWKNYPVCDKCALILEEGKNYLEEFLGYKFHGINYFIIPKLLMPEKSNEIYKILENFRKEIDGGNIKLKREYGNLLDNDENEVLEILAQQKNFLNNNFLFYNENKTNKEFKILLYIEDILPSRLKILFKSKKYVDNKNIFKEFTEEGKSFTFGNIWYFFQDKFFLEITNNIFTNKKIDYSFLISGITSRIQKEFANNNQTKLSTLIGFQLLDYLNHLGILEKFNGGTKINMNNIDTIFGEGDKPLDEKVNKLFEEFPDFFNQPAKRAIFLEGALAQLLLDVQYVERKSTPFRTKLHGLKLNDQLVKRLLPEIQNKLEEYDMNFYRELEGLISKYMILTGEKWKISKDEISFYFVLGMNLHYLFKSKKEEEKIGVKINE